MTKCFALLLDYFIAYFMLIFINIIIIIIGFLSGYVPICDIGTCASSLIV